jgi:PleD family two-component response regulator
MCRRSVLGILVAPDVPLVTRRRLYEEKPSFSILLAEDNVVNQVRAVHLFEKRGYSVVVAGNGRAVVEALETELFHLVLMDIPMPGIGRIRSHGCYPRSRKNQRQAHTHRGHNGPCIEG